MHMQHSYMSHCQRLSLANGGSPTVIEPVDGDDLDMLRSMMVETFGQHSMLAEGVIDGEPWRVEIAWSGP
jgi:hypothetical protein